MKRILIVSPLLLIVAACEKVIQPDLKKIQPQIIIEGVISNDGLPCEVKISQSVAFSETTTFEGINNALVRLSDNSGNTEVLTMTESGIYRGSLITGTPGKTYDLYVEHDAHIYTASSTMPETIALDAVLQKTQTANDNTRRFLTPVYADPAETVNYYRFKVYANREPIDKLFTRNDQLVNGTTVKQPLGPFFLELLPGDSATVFLHGIDKAVNDYFVSLSQTLEANNTAPANPVTNFSGGCQGYFSAQSTSSATTVILE